MWIKADYNPIIYKEESWIPGMTYSVLVIGYLEGKQKIVILITYSSGRRVWRTEEGIEVTDVITNWQYLSEKPQ